VKQVSPKRADCIVLSKSNAEAELRRGRGLANELAKDPSAEFLRRGALVTVESRSRKSAQDDEWSFCLTAGTLDPDHHPAAVDIAHLERNDFGHPQTRPIGGAQRRFVLEAGCRLAPRR
jgi:hypothetical protein